MQSSPAGLELTQERKAVIVRELTGFLQEEFEMELSTFRGELVVDFIAQKISAEVYNNALLDARAFISARLEDMEATLFAMEIRRN